MTGGDLPPVNPVSGGLAMPSAQLVAAGFPGCNRPLVVLIELHGIQAIDFRVAGVVASIVPVIDVFMGRPSMGDIDDCCRGRDARGMAWAEWTREPMAIAMTGSSKRVIAVSFCDVVPFERGIGKIDPHLQAAGRRIQVGIEIQVRT